MKKYLFLSFALLTSYSALAQSKEVLSGDYDNDGVITVADVTYMSEIILGHKQPVYITSPQAVDLEFKGQAFVDPTGTFPQFFKYSEGQGINVIGMRGQAWNSIYVDLNTVEEDGFTGHSDGGVFSLRQDDTQYLVASGFSEYSVDENGQLMLTFDYGRYTQWYNGNEKHLRDDYNYVVSKPTNFADGKASFEVCNLGALVRLSLSGLPANAWIGGVTLEGADGAPIFGHIIKVNVTADGPIVSVATDREDAYMEKMNLDTGDCWATADGKCEVYMMMAPVDLSGKKLNVLTEINGVPFRAEVQGQNMVSNHCYTYEAKDAIMQLDRKPLKLGENTIEEEGWSEQIFIPAVDGIYEITSTGSFDLYDASQSEIGYEMKANMPYRIYVHESSTLTIAKKEFTSFVLGTTQAVTAGTVYVLKITDAGAYYFKSGNDENYMWTNMIGEYHISFVDNNCYNLEAGSYYIRFNEDDQITIGAATPLTLGEANTVEAYSYYTFDPSEAGLYSFSSDVDNHIFVWGDNYWGPECNTPQSLVLTPEERALRVKVWNAGKLTIEKIEVPTIALSTDTQVRANFEYNRMNAIYQFTVTERAFYHIQVPEGYNVYIQDRGEEQDQLLDPGSYYICFYHWDWNNQEERDIMVNISKSAGEAEVIADPYASNTVQLSTEENAVYYRFRPTERGIYRLNVGDGCDFTILQRGNSRFMYLNDWEEYYVRFWSKSDDASMTSTTFSISKAEIEDMTVGGWVDVSTDKLYRLVGDEDDSEYYFSTKDGYHMACVERMGNLMENNRHWLWAGEECHLYFYHDTNSATTTQARVKKLDFNNAIKLPVGEETTAEFGEAYSFDITEADSYRIVVDEGCDYEIQDQGYNYSGWLEPGTYSLYFINSAASAQTSTKVLINTMAALAPTIELGAATQVTEGIMYKFVISEADDYRISISDGWWYDVRDYGPMNEPTRLDPGTYFIYVWRTDGGASETGTVTVSKFVNKEIALNTPTTVSDPEQWYKLYIPEDGTYQFSVTNDWMYNIRDYGWLGTNATLSAGTYYILFYPQFEGVSASAQVTISKVEVTTVSLDETFTVSDPSQLYSLEITEGDVYRISMASGWRCKVIVSAYYTLNIEDGNTGRLDPGTVTLQFERTDDEAVATTSVTFSKVPQVSLHVGENPNTISGQMYSFVPTESGFYAIVCNHQEENCTNYEYYLSDGDTDYYYLNADPNYGSTIRIISVGGTITITKVDAIPVPEENTVRAGQSTTFEYDKCYKIVIPETGYYRLRFDDDTSYQWWTIMNAEGTYSLSDTDSYEIPAGTYYFKSWWDVTATICKDEE